MTDTWADLFAAVINLDDSRDRWDCMSRRLQATGLTATRLPAVDGRIRPAGTFEGYDELGARRLMGRPLLGAELGCFASHVAFLEAFLESGCRFGLVLEDDADVSPLATERLQAALAALAETGNWDVVNCCAAPSRFFRRGPGTPDIGLMRAYYFPMRTTALLWSREGAQRFLTTQRRIRRPIDLELRAFVGASGRGLAFRPAIFPPIDGESTIGAGQDSRRLKMRTPAYRLRVLWRHLRENFAALVRSRLPWRMEPRA